MNFYIKEWPDSTATLMTEHGRVVWTFSSVEEAAEDGYEIAEHEAPMLIKVNTVPRLKAVA